MARRCPSSAFDEASATEHPFKPRASSTERRFSSEGKIERRCEGNAVPGPGAVRWYNLIMNYWLLKSEPSTYSIDDLKKDGKTFWDGVRNYQARNFMRDGMKKGDLVLFYHSNAEPAGVAGICKVVKEGYPETKDPTWVGVEVEFVEKFKRFVPLDELKTDAKLKGMLVVKRGMRLSVQPVEKVHFEEVCRLGA